MSRAYAIMITCLTVALPACTGQAHADTPTYAERLGWPEGSKVAIFHIDDAGMHHDANVGTIEALENGITTSTSIMAPCSWVPEFIDYLEDHPDVDAGLHMTLNAEWGDYRWPPLAGAQAVPSLVDDEGCLWPGVHQTIARGEPDEVELELRAQLDRLLTMGYTPTHLDTHMGTVMYPPFFERALDVAKENDIPIMIMGGHMQYMGDGMGIFKYYVRGVAKRVWEAGLPVLDDLETDPANGGGYEQRKANVIERLRNMQPGITQFIVHCTRPGPVFPSITGSGGKRLDELRIVTDPDVKKVIEDEGIILTTWRELKARRDKVE